jgi:hypothetical protein
MKLKLLMSVLAGPAILCGTGCQEKKGSTGTRFAAETMVGSESGVAYVDENFRFSIRGLDPKWRLLEEQERLGLLPDAAALVSRVGGAYGAVIVEPYPAGDLASYMEMISSNMEGMLGEAKAGELREVDFAGGKAQRRTLTGKLQGIDIDYEIMTFLHQGMGYQVLAWMPRGDAGRDPVEEFIQSVGIEEGLVKMPPPPAAPDAVGVGNRIRGGRFESAVSRLAATPVDGWGLMWGQSLELTGDDAEVGLNRPDQGLYITVAHQPVAPEDEADFVEAIKSAMGDELQPVGAVEWDFCGTPVKALGAVVPGSPGVRVFLANVVRNGRGYRVKAWHLEQQGVDHRDAIAAGMKAFTLLDDTAAAELRTELEQMDDRPGSVGEGFSVRGGVFRSFAEGVEWKSPSGFWQIDAGDAARQHNEICAMHAAEAGTGMMVQLVAEDLEESGIAPGDYHDLIVSGLEQNGFELLSSGPETLQVDGQEMKRSRFVYRGDDGSIGYHVVTAVVGSRAYQTNCFGPVAATSGEAEAVSRAIEGFSFPGKKLRAVESRGGRHRDLRMGFELRPPAGMTAASQANHQVVEKLGSNIEFRGKDGMMSHTALQAGGSGNDASIATQMVGQIFKLNLDRSTAAGSAERTETIAGQTASVRSGISDGTHIRIAVFRRGGVLHMGLVAAGSERKAEKLLADYKSGFSLLP